MWDMSPRRRCLERIHHVCGFQIRQYPPQHTSSLNFNIQYIFFNIPSQQTSIYRYFLSNLMTANISSYTVGTFSVKVSFTISLPVNSPRLRQERELVHFHSVSCVGREPSSAETGTHPPNEKRRFLITTAEWRLRGRGAGPCVVTNAHCTFSVEDRASTCQ